MSAQPEDRIHPATPARQQTIWRDGDYAKSQELTAAIQLVGALLIGSVLFGSLASWLKGTMVSVYAMPVVSTEQATTAIVPQLQSILFSSMAVIGSIGVAMIGLGVASHWCQTGVVMLGNKLTPDVGRLSPCHWFARLFSRSNFVFAMICVPKILLALGVMAGSCWVHRDSFFNLGTLPADEIGGSILQLALLISGQVVVILLIGAGIDYWLRYLSYQTRIRMTDQELREEEKMQSRKGARR